MPAYSGLWNGHYGVNHSLVDSNASSRQWSQLFRGRRLSNGKELLLTLNGVAPGAAALYTYTRAKGESNPAENVLGGVRVIETVTVINRNSAAADVTAINNAVTLTSAPTTYPIDPSGNTGGGKRGF